MLYSLQTIDNGKPKLKHCGPNFTKCKVKDRETITRFLEDIGFR